MINSIREKKYLVIKTKELSDRKCKLLLDFLEDNQIEIVECAVAEAGCPDYEKFCQMIEEQESYNRIKVQRFKPSGKFYDEFEFFTKINTVHDIIDALKASEGYNNYYSYLITGEGFKDDNGYPHIIKNVTQW